MKSPRRCQVGREGSGCLWGAPRSAARRRLVARGLRPVGRRDDPRPPVGVGQHSGGTSRYGARGPTRSVVAFMYERVDPPPPPPPTTTARAVPSSTSSPQRGQPGPSRDRRLFTGEASARAAALPTPLVCPARGNHPTASETSGRVPSRSAVKEQLTRSHSSSSREKRRRLLPERRACFFPARGPLVLPITPAGRVNCGGRGGAVRPPGGLFSGRWSRFLESAAGRRARLARSKRRWRIGISAVGGSNSGGRCPPSM